MRAGIIAAGEGTRLSHFFAGIPKPLIPIHGTTMIGWLLSQLDLAGFSDISIVIRQEHNQVAEYLAQLKLRAHLRVIQQNTQGGMYSLFALQPYLEEAQDFFLFTTDNFFDVHELLNFIQISKQFKDRTLTTWVTPRSQEDEGQIGIEMDINLRILELGKHLHHTPLVAEGPFHCYPLLFEGRKEAEQTMYSRFSDYLQLLLKSKHIMYGHFVPQVLDVDDWFDYQRAIDFLTSIQKPLFKEDL